MLNLESLLLVGGILHLGPLCAGVSLPKVLKLGENVSKLNVITRQIVWVHGLFIVLTVVAIAMVSIFQANTLASGTPLARSVCAFVAVFWGARLAIQLFVLDVRPYVANPLLKAGYHGLTMVFAYFAAVYGFAALWPMLFATL